MTDAHAGESQSVDRGAVERVKTAALATGVRVDTAVLDALGGNDALTIHEYATTGGITLELQDEVLVNAPFDEPYCPRSPLELSFLDEELVVALDGEDPLRVERVLPLPGYLSATDAEGRLVRDTTMSHADRIRVSPIEGCAYNCSFCDLAALKYRLRPVEQILQGIDVALADTTLPPRHLLLSGGSPGMAEKQQRYFETVCHEVVRHIRAATRDFPEPFDVDVMMSARPDGPEFVERIVEAGAASFSFNVELYSDEGARRHIPLKHKRARPHLEATIARAVELLGRDSGRVRSLIIPGLEPIEATLEGVEWLASLGCHPVLSPFRPARGTQLAARAPVSADDLATVLAESRRIVARHGVALGPRCAPCQHNTLSFPWDVTALAPA